MAPTTISIARVLQLRVPIAWQEAVEVARAAEAIAERHSRRLTVEGCLISTSGTVEVGTNGADLLGVSLSGLQLLAILLEGQPAPAELRALAATANDPLSSFPSETNAPTERTLTLDWFVHPNPEVEIATLATRALEAASPAVAPHRGTQSAGANPLESQRRAPTAPYQRAGGPPQPVVETARPVPSAPMMPERGAEPPTPAAVERRAGPSAPAAVAPLGQTTTPASGVRRVEPTGPAAAALRAASPAPADVQRRAEPPKPVAIDRPVGRPQSHWWPEPRVMRHESAAAERAREWHEPAVPDPGSERHESVPAERGREPAAPVAAVAHLRAEVPNRTPVPAIDAPQVRPVTRAIGDQLAAVIDRGTSLGVAPLAAMAVVIVAAGALATWAVFSPDLPAPLTFRSLGPLAPLARAFEPNLPFEAPARASRETSMASSGVRPSTAGTSGSVASRTGTVGLRADGNLTPVPQPPGPAMPTNAGTFTAPPSAGFRVAPPPSTAVPPSPAGRVVATTLGAEPRDRRVYTADDSDVEPPTMRRPQLQLERRADTEPSDSYVEVVVDEEGEVTQVRLRSSDLSLNDRMIVAAAKAWQFEPAMKDGRPVKYVLRLPVTR